MSFFSPSLVKIVPLNRMLPQSLGSSQPESSDIDRSVTSRPSGSTRTVSPTDRANGASSAAFTGSSSARARLPAAHRMMTNRTGTSVWRFMVVSSLLFGHLRDGKGNRFPARPDEAALRFRRALGRSLDHLERGGEGPLGNGAADERQLDGVAGKIEGERRVRREESGGRRHVG